MMLSGDITTKIFLYKSTFAISKQNLTHLFTITPHSSSDVHSRKMQLKKQTLQFLLMLPIILQCHHTVHVLLLNISNSC